MIIILKWHTQGSMSYLSDEINELVYIVINRFIFQKNNKKSKKSYYYVSKVFYRGISHRCMSKSKEWDWADEGFPSLPMTKNNGLQAL